MDTDIWLHATQLINWYASLYSMGYLASLAYAIVKLLSTSIAGSSSSSGHLFDIRWLYQGLLTTSISRWLYQVRVYM